MSSAAVLSSAHMVYLLGVVAIVITMIFRANVVVPAIIATFCVAWAYSGSLVQALESVFNGSLTAARELFNIFLVIALMTALLNALKALKSDIRMVEPFRKVMVNGHVAYWVLALITYLISLFFWPTPAVPLVGAILLPAAILAGLPAMGTALAIAIAGQGMALSSDYIIRVAPGISAKAAGVAMPLVADRAMTLSLIVGGIALMLGYLSIRRSITAPGAELLHRWEAGETLKGPAAPPAPVAQPVLAAEAAEPKAYAMLEPVKSGSFDKAALAAATDNRELLATEQQVEQAVHSQPGDLATWSKVFAIVTPVAFLGIVLYMLLPKFVLGMADIKGGDAAALVGGMATVLMILATLACCGRKKFLETTADHIIDGFVFAFKAMGAVLPIAGFFFIGAADTAGAILGLDAHAKAPGFMFELVQSVQSWIPHNHFFAAFGVLIVGMITGIDGSGFAGLPLTGALSGALGNTVGMDPATLAAVGQMGAVWTGGGTLVAWSSLIAVTGFARVPVLDAVRQLFLPVIAGLFVATLAAVVLW